MHLRPLLLRLAAALILTLGLWGVFVTPSHAQESTPEAEVTPVDEPSAEGVAIGTLHLQYFLCNGDAGFKFTVGLAGDPSPEPEVVDCALANALAGTDATFLVYEFGDTNSVPQEITTVDGVVDVPFPETSGTPHKITQKLPVDSEDTPIEAEFEIVADTITGVNATQFQVGSVELHKFRCTGDPADSTFNVLNPGDVFDPTPYVDCGTDDRDFTITPFDDDVKYGTIALSTVDGLATADDVPTTNAVSGAHKIAEDGTELVGDFDVEPGETTVIVAVNYEVATGSLEINKLECAGDDDTAFYINEDPPQAEDPTCAPASADFSIYLNSDLESTPIAVTTGEDGFGEALNLPVTTDSEPHLLVEDATSAQVAFEIEADSATIISVVNFTPPPPADGTAKIKKLECAGITESAITPGQPGDPAEEVPSSCGSGIASFWIYLYGDEQSEPISVTVDGSKSVALPPTDGEPHLIVEVDEFEDVLASAYVEIESDTITPIQVQNPAYGSVKIYSFVCEGDDDAEFDVFEPGEAGELPADCDSLSRSFVITTFGGEELLSGDSVELASDSAGSIRLDNIPATADVAHLISTTSGDVSASFTVDAEETTVIVYIAWEPAAVDDTEDSENVEELADTGTGASAANPGGGTLLLSILSLLAIAGLAACSRRRSLR